MGRFIYGFDNAGSNLGFWREPVRGIEAIGRGVQYALHDAYVHEGIVTAGWIPRQSVIDRNVDRFEGTSVPINDLALVVARRLGTSRDLPRRYLISVYHPEFNPDAGIVEIGPKQLAYCWDLCASQMDHHSLRFNAGLSRPFSAFILSLERQALGALRPGLVQSRHRTVSPPSVPPCPRFYAHGEGAETGEPTSVWLTGEKDALAGLRRITQIVADLTQNSFDDEPLIGQLAGSPVAEILKEYRLTPDYVKDFASAAWCFATADTLAGGAGSIHPNADDTHAKAFIVFNQFPLLVERTGISLLEMRNVLAGRAKFEAMEQLLLAEFRQRAGKLANQATDDDILEAFSNPGRLLTVSLAPSPYVWRLVGETANEYSLVGTGVAPGFDFDLWNLPEKVIRHLEPAPAAAEANVPVSVQI